MDVILHDIPVTDLRPGMTVWQQDPKGRWIPDVYLTDYFLGSYSPREFINGHRLQFMVGDSIKVWRNSGRVMVSIGRVPKGTNRKG